MIVKKSLKHILKHNVELKQLHFAKYRYKGKSNFPTDITFKYYEAYGMVWVLRTIVAQH